MANHITQWKPQANVDRETIIFGTYKELRRNIKPLLQRSTNNEVSVSRSLRGEWGTRTVQENLQKTTKTYENL